MPGPLKLAGAYQHGRRLEAVYLLPVENIEVGVPIAMREKFGMTALAAALSVVLASAASPALAYIGPGAGISAIGTFFAVIGAVVLLIVGFLWYPVKRMLRKKKESPAQASVADNSDSTQSKP
jgi:membrane associated rhomboid family serine protease